MGIMRKTLLATTALACAGALAAGSAAAADKMSVGVGGYMQQWFGISSVDATDEDGKATAVEGGVAQQSDSEIHFKGSLEADNGLTFSLTVELEGNSRSTGKMDAKSGKSSNSVIDESRLSVSGEFGKITLGAEDAALVLTHKAVRDAGFGITCGDVGKWINGIDGCSPNGLGTAGHGLGDKNNVTYFTPRVNGVQVGATYVPNVGQEGEAASLKNNDADAWAIGGNYVGEFGGANVAASAGHYAKTQKGDDDFTYSNFGLNVGMGAVSFDIAYAEADDGKDANTANDVETVAAGVMYSDGPMAVSLSYMMADAKDDTEQSAALLSASYALAPGVAWRSTLFAAEKDSADGSNVEGTGFVTGITLGF